MPTLYLLCGKIGAGKSTLARQLAARPSTILISEDHWTSTLFADQLKTIEDYGRLSARLRAAIAPHIVDILGQGLSVVLDFSGEHGSPARLDAVADRRGQGGARAASPRHP